MSLVESKRHDGEDNTDWLGDDAPPAVILKGKNDAPFADGAGNSDDPARWRRRKTR